MVVRAGDILRRAFFFGPGGVDGVAILELLGGKIKEHFLRPFRLAVHLRQHILRRVAEADAAHAGGVRADGSRIAGGLHALHRIPRIDYPHGVFVGNAALINVQMPVPPVFQLFKLPVRRAGFAQRGQRSLCSGDGLIVVGQRAFGDAEEEADLFLSPRRQGDLRVQRAARLAALQICTGQAAVLNLNG